MKFKEFDIVRIREDNSYAQIEKVTSSHGKISYILNCDNQDYFKEDLILVCKCKNRVDDWINT